MQRNIIERKRRKNNAVMCECGSRVRIASERVVHYFSFLARTFINVNVLTLLLATPSIARDLLVYHSIFIFPHPFRCKFFFVVVVVL